MRIDWKNLNPSWLNTEIIWAHSQPKSKLSDLTKTTSKDSSPMLKTGKIISFQFFDFFEKNLIFLHES